MPSLVSFVRNLLSRSHSTSDVQASPETPSTERPARLRRNTSKKPPSRSRSASAAVPTKRTLPPADSTPRPPEEDWQVIPRSASMRGRRSDVSDGGEQPMSQNPRRQSMRRKPVPSIVPNVPPLPSLPSAGSAEGTAEPVLPVPPTPSTPRTKDHPAFQIHVVKPSEASVIDITHDTPLPSPSASRSAFLTPPQTPSSAPPQTPSLSSSPRSAPGSPLLATPPPANKGERHQPFTTFFPVSYSEMPETSFPDIRPRGPNRTSMLSILSWGKKIPVANN